MALERSPVLPVGFYWLDLIGQQKRDRFLAWRSGNAALVKLRSSREHVDQGRTWVLFEVTIPAPFPGAELGFPTRAPLGASTTEDDTVERPDPTKDASDQLADAVNVKTLVEGAKTFSWVFGLALGLYGLSKLKKS